MQWNNSHTNPPEQGQKVYYFGVNIGIGIGHYKYEEQSVNGHPLCPHIFTNVKFGIVDACDAPFWLPYDEERAKGWVPIIPEQFTKGLYDG